MINPPTETLAHRLARRNRTNNTMSMLSMAVEEMAGLTTEIEHWKERARKAEADNESLMIELGLTKSELIKDRAQARVMQGGLQVKSQHGATITIISNP